MPIAIHPYREEHQDAVKAFNQRLRTGTGEPDLVFYERANPVWLPRIEGSPLYNQYFVALDDGAVRGAYALKYERFYRAGHGEYTVACYHHPLSEGIVDRAYSAVGSLLLRDAVWREPMLYALGMGGLDRPLAKMLKVMGWNLRIVSFYFRVVHAYRFLRQMNALRQSPLKRLLMDLGAFTGTGWAAINSGQSLKRATAQNAGSYDVAQIDEFPDWTDSLWLEAKEAYALASVRDRQTLSRLYPATHNDLTKLCVTRDGEPLGWAVIGERRKDAKYGSLRVGSIVDCWAQPDHAAPVIRAAAAALEEKGVDLIVSNQSHKRWGQALAGAGFFQAESNFVFATSKKHSAMLQSVDLADCHLNRANGDGLPRNF